MAEYNFRCTDCGHEWNMELEDKFEVMDVYDQPCPHCGKVGCIEKYIPETEGAHTFAIIDSVRLSGLKNDNGWKETLAKIHEGTPGSTLNRKF